MTQQIFIGVDGGATKSVVRVEDEAGNVLGVEVAGPASVRLSVEDTWHAIYSALNKILSPRSIKFGTKQYQLHAGMGLAGCELEDAKRSFLQTKHHFKTLIITSDAHTACLGAHQGADGAIIIIGTGVVGYQIESAHVTKVGGWGFPHDDEGGGAWLGLKAVNATCRWLDGRSPGSPMTDAIFSLFNLDRTQFVTWINQANSTGFATLAPKVVAAFRAQDPIAQTIMRDAASHIDQIADVLSRATNHARLPCALIGGIAKEIEPLLAATLRARLRPSLGTPDCGAIMMVRAKIKEDYDQ